MATEANPRTSDPRRESGYWLVGAYWKGFDPPDQTARFLEERIWENGYDERAVDLIKAMKVGDRIALKAATVQKRNLPFEADGRSVPKMVGKAVGTITPDSAQGHTAEAACDLA